MTAFVSDRRMAADYQIQNNDFVVVMVQKWPTLQPTTRFTTMIDHEMAKDRVAMTMAANEKTLCCERLCLFAVVCVCV